VASVSFRVSRRRWNLRVEDLMIMKSVAQRPQDLLDVEGLIETHPAADLGAVRQWVREFSMAAAMPSLLEEFDRLVARVTSRQR
jgi:hypothetical protein